MSIVVDPQDTDRVLAGLLFGGIRASQDGGASWTIVSGGMPAESECVRHRIDPANSFVIYAADRLSGVYRSQDGGISWHAMNDGLRMRSVNKLARNPDGSRLYAATEGEGVDLPD